ncbi:MAG TPA: hypothetical protein PLI55_09975 [Candidatus Marinimicrobia bacterium]|nr:hypothetical protein [Candidatus Neomarinimicrobiota bacterium]
MGTQQILMIVLSVIIVGVAVGVGITMFQNQAINSNRQAVIADLNNFGAQAVAWYKLPKNMGGGGNEGFTTTPEGGGEPAITAGLLSYLGFVDEDGLPVEEYTNDNGTYTVDFTEEKLTIEGVGKEKVATDTPVKATLTIDMGLAPGQQISVKIDN